VYNGLGICARPKAAGMIRAAARCLVQLDRHVGRNVALAVDQIVERLARDAQNLRRLGDREVKRLNAIVAHGRPGCGGFFMVMAVPPVS
jgi:hypothetical protein